MCGRDWSSDVCSSDLTILSSKQQIHTLCYYLLFRVEIERQVDNLSRADSLKEMMSRLLNFLKPIVLSVAVSTSFGRHSTGLGECLATSGYPPQIQAAANQESGAGLIICTSKRRPDYEEELEDIHCILATQLNIRVHVNHLSQKLNRPSDLFFATSQCMRFSCTMLLVDIPNRMKSIPMCSLPHFRCQNLRTKLLLLVS